MYTKEEIDLIVLSGFYELSYNVKKSMISRCGTFSSDFLKNDSTLIKTLPRGVYNKVKGKFSDPAYRAKNLNDLSAKGITCVTLFSESYPEPLRNIPDPPVVLYCKGDVSLLKSRCFSVVGSRKSSRKTCAECRKISGDLAAAFTVVSGIAEGADSCALEGAMGRGKVISVLANGFDHVYPASNANLIKKIAEEGLLVSEYSPEIQAKPYHFPFRNRIIAGLSLGTLVVSAGAKSGALITADYAADFGRDVFAFPYSIGSSEGVGCNSLIKNGAYLVENILDIFQVYGLDFKKPESAPLTDTEKEVYGVVSALGEAFVSVIADKTGIQPYKLIPVLSSLEIKGMIIRLGGNRYAAV